MFKGCLITTAGLFGLIVLLAVIGSNSNTDRSDPKEIKDSQACGIAEKFVSNRLKAPSTAKFPWSCNAIKNGNQWTVRGYVDAQNSFGAMLRSHYTVIVHPTEWQVDRWYWELDSIDIK
jgi:hypothetical protein